MSNLIIPAAGAVLGFWLGGPVGMSLGWSLGSYAYASTQDPELPQIGDLKIQTSGYGSTIPFVSGKQRIAGNIIWSTNKVSHQQKQGGKGSGPETVYYTYTISMAIALCTGPIVGVSKVWEDGTLKASPGGKLPGTLYLGSDTQIPDPVMEANEGAGNVPAYRGISYIVLEDFDLGVSGRVPMFSFLVEKEGAL